ncbi:Phage capsid scaffolding protein (GPO) serine peptidase [Persephonella hydrogeniphila]|uniref:Phage capsid scaffolding protein (GPO) serine peptidase n=1 Tax=Persephonella hydrogeniphila TaxID=198703 RepID=A0A285NE71_9AQUI|nr:hypothetical protein [Persephonella hydrogeniphila]SNZ07745.1 Phage capsid scaffolding protein (GPO) serine peptidase [Persephonella hydrogeniphila]
MEVILACEGIKRNGLELTPEIINQIVETFSDLNYKPPIVLGHISDYKDGDPAYGRVLSLKTVKQINGKTCLAGELKLSNYLQSLMNSGEYDGFSIGVKFDPETNKAYLHHLAVLGAYPPADQTAGEPLQLSLSENELKNLTTFEIKLSDKGGKQMDIKDIIQNEEFKKSIAQIVKETVQKQLNLSTKEQKEEKPAQKENKIENLYKQEKIQRLKDIALSVGMGEEGIKALEQFGQLLKPVINLSDGTEFSPFDLLEKALKDIKPRADKEDLFKDINLSSSSENYVLDTTQLARMFTGGDK